MRCFVAIELPDEVRAAVVGAQQALRAAAPRTDVRWAAPNQLHLTLKFLGAVADDRVPAVSAALDGVARDTAPVPLSAAGLGAFPNPRRARVLWSGIGTGTEALAALAAAIDRALAALGFPAETRPFSAHLTLGRVRTPRGAERLADAVAGAGASSYGSWTATELVLYESRLRPTGAVHTPVSRHPLRGPGR
jgi:2'-5' RNA ligase